MPPTLNTDLLTNSACAGKTTTTEFAAIHIGPATRNPHDPTRTPGGSSAGSGAAVSDFQVPIALGTQTGGSTIRPASFNGIYGFKPTWNSISREGQKVYALILDTLGLYARCIDDLVLLADVFDLEDDEEETYPFHGVDGARFAICKTSVWGHAGEGTRRAMARAAILLKAHGAIVEELDLGTDFANMEEWYRVVLHSEGRTAFLSEYRAGKDQLHDVLVSHVENVDQFSHKTQLAAFDGIAALRPRMDEIAGRYAAIITPSVPDEAPVGLRSTGSHVFCSMWTVRNAFPSHPIIVFYPTRRSSGSRLTGTDEGLRRDRRCTTRSSMSRDFGEPTACPSECLWLLHGIGTDIS